MLCDVLFCVLSIKYVGFIFGMMFCSVMNKEYSGACGASNVIFGCKICLFVFCFVVSMFIFIIIVFVVVFLMCFNIEFIFF